MFILKRKHYCCSKKIQMSWLYCFISTASLTEEEGWPKTKDGKALLDGERDSFVSLRAKNCFWICPGMLVVAQPQQGAPCPSLLLGCSSSFSAAGHFPLVEAARSCSPGTRPPVCCGALLNSAPKDCLKPKLNTPTTKTNKRSHHPWYSCFFPAFLNKVSSTLGREGSFNCRIYEKQPSHCIK